MEASLSRNNKIPHPPKLPWLGNLHQLSAHNPTQCFMDLHAKYGELVEIFVPMPVKSIVSIGSYQYAQEVFDESRFDKNLTRPLIEVQDFAGDGLFTAWTSNPNWHKAHNILLPGLGQRAMKGYFPMMLDIAEHLLAKWHNIPEGKFFNLTDDMTRLTLDTIGLCGFDYRFNSFASHKLHPFVDAMVFALEDAMQRMLLFPIQKKLRFAKNRRYQKSVDYMNNVVDEIIRERKKNPEKYANKADFLSLMLNATDKATGEQLSDVNIRYQIITFLIAGHETTSGLLSFAFYLLLQHPEVLEKAYLEVDTVLGQDLRERPSYEQVMSLQYIQQILFESLRLWPTAPAFSVYPYEDTLLANRFQLRQRQPVVVLLPTLHRDPVIWGENAEQFNPDNFAPDKVASRPADAYKPFGNGQRACIGRQFAMLEATLLVGLVLQRYKMNLKPNYQFKIKETLTLKPDNLEVCLESRRDEERYIFQTLRKKESLINTQESTSNGHQTPLQVFYGSNMGASEEFAQTIARQAEDKGFQVGLAPLDEAKLPISQKAYWVIVSATYNGTPPDNARKFAEQINNSSPESAKGLGFTVFGCGNTQWAQTFQAFPRQIQTKLQALGGESIAPMGEADASLSDFEVKFEAWLVDLWQHLEKKLNLKLPQSSNKTQNFELLALAQNPSKTYHYQPRKRGEVFEVLLNKELQNPQSETSTRQLTLALPQTKSGYLTGGHFAVYPENEQETIEQFCNRFNLDAKQLVQLKSSSQVVSHLPLNQTLRLEDLLRYHVELQSPPSKKGLARLIESTACPPEQMRLKSLLQDYENAVQAKNYSLLDILLDIPGCEISLEETIAMLPAMRPRYYSISSAAELDAQKIELTVGRLSETSWYNTEKTYKGLASNYLAERTNGDRVEGFLAEMSGDFFLPEDSQTPMIWVAAGTGLSPFMGFLQAREVMRKKGQVLAECHLFFGCRHPEQDFIYQNELENYQKSQNLQVNTAFSRLNPQQKIYVQDKIREQADKLWNLLEAGAIVYVCGDAKGMAKGVAEAFKEIYQKQRDTSAEKAHEWLEGLRQKGLYREDIWS